MSRRLKKINGEVFDMYLGTVGAGKTLIMNERCVLPSLLNGEDVFSSYWVNWKHQNYNYFSDFSDVSNVDNCVVAFDEVGHILDKRSWDKEGDDVRIFFMYHRHNFVDIFANTQHYDLIAKTALMQVDRFFMCDKLFKHGSIVDTIFLNFPLLVIKVHQMTKSDIQLLDKPVFKKFSYSEDGESQQEEDPPFQSINTDTEFFWKKKLTHRELDKHKIELVHSYCPQCQHRQGEQILARHTKDVCYFDDKKDMYIQGADLGKCPKHKSQSLEIRESTMYDSHYKPVQKEQDIIWKPFVKGDPNRLVPYRGILSSKDKQEREKKMISLD
jgi:hypothetical protein